MINRRLIIVDAHVHIYDFFKEDHFLDQAYENFKKEAEKIVPGALFTPFIFLAETETEDWFQLHFHQIQSHRLPYINIGHWTFQGTDEDCSVSACLDLGEPRYFFIIAGRQIKSEDNLEVLALGTKDSIRGGIPVNDLINLIRAKGALPVIPWGAGKWLGARGQTIKRLLADQEGPLFFLGDTRNRPVLWPRSSIFKKGTRKGFKTLPGSDPLPLSFHEKFPGSYGFWLWGEIQWDKPFMAIKKILLNPEIGVDPFGKRVSPLRFIQDQFFLRTKTRK